MKHCSKCHADLPLSGFAKFKRGGYRPRCRACCAAYGRAYYAAHREEAKAYNAVYGAAHREEKAARSAAYHVTHREERAAGHLRRKYDLTTAARAEMAEQQRGMCAIRGCGAPATYVDHCHKCEDIDRRAAVRGLLCSFCNRNLDHIARFSPIHAAYLARHAAACPARVEVAA